jgi:hypothetical protein
VPILGGTSISVQDQFRTENRFYGGQVGLRGEMWRGDWFVSGFAKVAFGNSHEVVKINGATTIGGADIVSQSFPGGLLAVGSNIGDLTHNTFAVVPELGVQVGAQLTPYLRAFIGYDFLYWGRVVRPGEQIDPVVNLHQVPSSLNFNPGLGVARPTILFKESDFWAQGVTAGLEFHF